MARTPPTSSRPPHRYQSSNLKKYITNIICSSPLQLSPPGLESLSVSRLLYQVKFGADISVTVGEKVKMIIFDLVVSYSC